jgi:hypothetical protein
MKNILIFSLSCLIGFSAVAQRPQVNKNIYTRNCRMEQAVTREPVEKVSVSPVVSRHRGLKSGDNSNIITVLDLGTSANVLGYSGGTRTMLWADDDLNVVANFHRMGPGATPPSLSGYLGMDLGLNMGLTQSDWTSQIQVHSATMAASPYYYDASRYPSAAIYNPAGNTSLANAYLAYFAPNFANLAVSGFGGYSFGTANLADHADTTKHLRWYNAHPYTYIPDGFTISKTGIAHIVDRDMNVESGTPVYQDSIIYGRGVWNTVTKDFDYTFKTLAFPCVGDAAASDCKIAVSPDGNIVWISVLTNYPGATPLNDSSYYPVLRRSFDGGLNWSPPIVVQLDGPNGIDAIKQRYSDYFIQNFFAPPYPTRDQIPYTTAFDHSLSVDQWGFVHIGVAIGYAPGGYSITTGVDSLINVIDITFCNANNIRGVPMGYLKTFRGTWATYTSDNRVYVSRNKTGDKMFFTWNDTRIDGEINNQSPEVYARGYDLISNKLTSVNGTDQPTNVTLLSDISKEAYWQCTSPIVFTDNNKFTLPICTQWFADPTLDATFKYIPDFSYVQGDFSIWLSSWPYDPCPVGIENTEIEPESLLIYPNPVVDMAKVSLNLNQPANVLVEITNLIGQRVLSLKKGSMDSGLQQFTVDVRHLSAGVYFITVIVNGEKFTRKMIVE